MHLTGPKKPTRKRTMPSLVWETQVLTCLKKQHRFVVVLLGCCLCLLGTGWGLNRIGSNWIDRSTYVPIYLSTYLPVYLCTYLPIYLSTYLPNYLPTYLPIYISTYLPIYISIYLSTYLYIYLSICLYVCLSTYLSIYLPIYISTYSAYLHIYPSESNGIEWNRL